MKLVALLAILLLTQSIACQNGSSDIAEKTPVVFVSFVGNDVQLQRVCKLAESIRTFAGRYSEAPIWVYGPQELVGQDSGSLRRLAAMNVVVKQVTIPEETSWFFLSGMVFSAAKAEAEAEGTSRVLVFMGSDTIVLQEPDEFDLAEGIILGYHPVIHKNISPLMAEPLDTYWRSAYRVMDIKEASLFPMVTPADGDTIRPYFNAGCFAVRPEHGLLGKWEESFKQLCQDSIIRLTSELNVARRIFTFQVAFAGTILNNLDRNEMTQFSDRYNYPIFFREMYGAKRDFHDITGVTTMRYEQFFDNPLPDWDKTLQGPADRIAWLKDRFDSNGDQ